MEEGSAGGVPGVAELQGLLVVSVFLQGAAVALYQAATALALRCATALAPHQPATALALYQAATALALRCAIALAPHQPATALAPCLAAIPPALHQAATALALSCATALALHQAATAPALRHVTALMTHQGLQLSSLLDVQHARAFTSVVGDKWYTLS